MGMIKRLSVAAVALLLLSLGRAGLAQQPTPSPSPEAQTEAMEDIQLSRAAIQVERQAIVTRAMDLTPAEMETFWPLYREYRREASKVGDRIVALIERYAANYDDMTDAAADKLLTDFVKIEQTRAGVRAKFLPRFKKVLPPKKVARFYQLEHKLDMLILNEIAEAVPLVR